MIPPQNVSEAVYRREVAKRREACRSIILSNSRPDWAPLAMLVLSCKRPEAAQRLLKSLGPLRRAFPGMPSIWVDNGSGDEIVGPVRNSQLFQTVVAHGVNRGMGSAINESLENIPAELILFVEDDLIYIGHPNNQRYDWVEACLRIFAEFPEIGIIKLKAKADWDTLYPYRRIGPMQTTSTGVRFHPWLPSPRWSVRWGQRPWYPSGQFNVWSLGPVMFRWCSWKENGPIPSGQGRGQAIAAENIYGRTYNAKWLAARPCDFAPFSQPTTPESPGFGDRT